MWYVHTEKPTRCSQCKSQNVAKLVNEGYLLVCLDCGHKEKPPKIFVSPDTAGHIWIHAPVDHDFVEF